MTTNTNVDDRLAEVVTAFCNLCYRAHYTWRMHKAVFDDNPSKGEMKKSVAGMALEHFNEISIESFLHQIAKLHDPALRNENKKNGEKNLGIKYMIRFGGWDKATEEKLLALENRLNQLAVKILPARNKLLSHNDREAILSGKVLGEFDLGEDDKYFTALQEFVNVITMSLVQEPWPFDEVANKNAEGLRWFFREEACKNQPIII